MTTTIERARHLRARHPSLPAKIALHWARVEQNRPERLLELARNRKVQHQGFTLHLGVEYDKYGDPSWLGVFTDRYEEGAVRNPRAHEGHVLRWFVPTQTLSDRVEDLRSMGIARGPAYEEAMHYVREDLERARDYAAYVLVVIARKRGVELGRALIGDVVFAEGSPTEDEIVAALQDSDLIEEATDEAHETLRDLCNDGSETP